MERLNQRGYSDNTSRYKRNITLLFDEALKHVQDNERSLNINSNTSSHSSFKDTYGDVEMLGGIRSDKYKEIWEHLNKYKQFLKQIEDDSFSIETAREPSHPLLLTPHKERPLPIPKVLPNNSPIQPTTTQNEENIVCERKVSVESEKEVKQVEADDIPIKGCAKTFEEMLEESLNTNANVIVNKEEKGNKSPFLKRKSKNVKPVTEVRKFNYYADKFNSNTKSSPSKRKIEKTEDNFTSEVKDVETVNAEVLKHPKEINEEQVNNKNADGEVKESKDTEELKQKLKDLDKEIEVLRKEQEEVKKQKVKYDSLVKELQGELGSINKDRSSKEIQTDEEEGEVIKLRKENKKLQEEIEAINFKKSAEIENIKKECEELSNRNKELEDKLKELKIVSKDEERLEVKDNIKSSGRKNKTLIKSEAQKSSKTPKISPEKINSSRQSSKSANVSMSKSHDATQTQVQVKSQFEEKSHTKSSKQEDVHVSTKKAESKPSKVKANHTRNNKLNSQVRKKESKATKEKVAKEEQKKKPLNKIEENKNIIKNISSNDTIKEESNSETEDVNELSKDAELTRDAFQSDPEEYDLVFPEQYHSDANVTIISNKVSSDGKVAKVFSNGKTELKFANGVRRESFPDGYTIVYFTNNDIKQTHVNGKVVYYFAKAKTTQTTFPDGLQVFKFPTGQLEKHYPDHTKEIA